VGWGKVCSGANGEFVAETPTALGSLCIRTKCLGERRRFSKEPFGNSGKRVLTCPGESKARWPLVTGVTSGVGRAEVTLLAGKGAKVVPSDISELRESGVPEDSGRWPRSRVGAVDVLFSTASVHRTVERLLRVFSESRPETFRQLTISSFEDERNS
jgi:hypothetical protein